jgi:hypothetical protein
MLFVLLGLTSLCFAAAAQTRQGVTEEDFIATWAGRYSGTESGGTFEITISRDDEGKLACCSGWSKRDDGEVSPWIVESVEYADGKVTITSFDSAAHVELVSRAELEGSSIKGTFVARALVDGSVIDRGTFTGTKKPSKNGS